MTELCMDGELLFEGLKVLDVSSWIAAPTSAVMLASMGAEVIKVEPPVTGDGYRAYYQLPAGPDSASNYTWILDNHNKRSLSLNLKSSQGMAILHRLIRDCDVYITNQPLALRRSLKLSWEDLEPLNQRLIYASLSPYGESGPERDKEAFDLVAYWSRSGLMNQMRHRHENMEPVQAMAGMGDHPTGVALYASIVTALLRRERTGRGSKVHTSLLANGLWSASCFAQAAFADSDFSVIPPQRVTTALYQAADGRWVQFSMVRTEEMFDRLVMALDRLEWLADARFSTMEARLENFQALTDLMRQVIATKTSAEWMQTFVQHDVPAALVAEFEDLPHDPQIAANEMLLEPGETLGVSHVVRDPINVDGVGRLAATRPPELGEHTGEILEELGYSAEDTAALRRDGII